MNPSRRIWVIIGDGTGPAWVGLSQCTMVLADMMEQLEARFKGREFVFTFVRINAALPCDKPDLVVVTTDDAWHWLLDKHGARWSQTQDFWHRAVTLASGQEFQVFTPGLRREHLPIEVFRAINTACESL